MIDDLERQGLIRKLPVDRKKVEDALVHARRDLATAGTIIANDQDWAYTIAYNAVLQAGRALMFSKGYRPDGANQHVAVVKFAELFLDPSDTIIFDRMRRKRNSSVYETAGIITEREAEFALEQAEILVRKIEACISP
ncbi:MAG: HEPN domain-containing protein [Methanoregula sp.]|nr:HEPN domain-containing protein [Methanoregula sp.]